jgi:S1-C subfamily serine protease
MSEWRGVRWSAGLVLVVLGLGCAEGRPAAEPSGWEGAAELVGPSVHSVWGSRAALGGRVRAFAPLGTAFAVTRDGVLLTNAHVVAGPDSTPVPRLHVLVQGDTTAVRESWIVALDVARDLALIRIADTTLAPVRWAEDRAPMGAPLATIGFGLPEGGIVDTAGARVVSEFTVFRRFTAGFSSGYRTLVAGDASTNVLEVDLFLFPGVSGGPTFGPDGRVVGVNRGRRRFGEGTTSYGHVIPRLVVGQFLEESGSLVGVDTAHVFHGVERSSGPDGS